MQRKPAAASSHLKGDGDDEGEELDEDEAEEDDEEESDDDDTIIVEKKPTAAAAIGKGAAMPAAKKPCGVLKAGALKRPAAAPAAAGRPKMPADVLGTTVMYGRGKVNVSPSKGAFRVFMRSTDRVDKLVLYRHYESRLAAWNAALDMVDGKHS